MQELSRFTYSLEESSLISSIFGVVFSFVKHLCAKLPGDIREYPGACRLRIYRFLAGCAVQANEWVSGTSSHRKVVVNLVMKFYRNHLLISQAKDPTKETHLLHGKAMPQFMLDFATKERCSSLLDILWLMLKANGSSPYVTT